MKKERKCIKCGHELPINFFEDDIEGNFTRCYLCHTQPIKEMEKETTYNSMDLERGKCTCCGEQSNEILIGDGRCIDCIEAEKFEEESRRLWGDDQPELPWL